MALNFSNTSEVLLGEQDKLDYEPINSKLKLLCSYDQAISRSFVNSIGIWHCSWYYDSTISGYAKGDVVWLNTEDPFAFVRSHHATIKQYTDLKAEILTKLPEYDSNDDSVVAKYLNALSGYIDSKSKNVKPLEPIFDLGIYSNPIQLAVSLKDNNKNLTSDDSAWKKLFVDGDDSEEKIGKTIAALKDLKLEKHLIDYHLSGKEEQVESQLSDYLDAPDKKIYYDSLPEKWYASSESEYGFDYVLAYVRKPLVLSGSVCQYQAARYWKSGRMEQFGTIATDNPLFVVSGGSYLKIPFDWNMVGDKSGAKAYESGELADGYSVVSAAESDENLIPPKDNFVNMVFEKTSVEVLGSKKAKKFKNSNYNVEIFPIFQNLDGIPEDYLEVGYGENSVQQLWNSNFITNEIPEELKEKNGFSIRIGTRIVAPFVSYHATGIGDF